MLEECWRENIQRREGETLQELNPGIAIGNQQIRFETRLNRELETLEVSAEFRAEKAFFVPFKAAETAYDSIGYFVQDSFS